ncbi:MAG: type I DNA topoisomerase [Thermacetogeniaceae bacterium]|jgi:DNA topoisomerase-1|nr:type I DNA topoisomerase [Thermoanaerobacterales bacterium]
MAKVLIIVESPAKARAISKLLGRKYSVKASLGHVRDLPKSQLGVNIENNFDPKYITIRGKGEVIKELRSAAKKADQILLGPDPDREGEAIAWHLKEILGISDDIPCRIEFHEITKGALKKAIKQPRSVDRSRFDAQQCRRVLDRLVGYKLSPLLWRKIKRGLSAGRVQSVAVYLICQREEEIQQFQTEEYWSITGHFRTDTSDLEGLLVRKGNEKISLASEEDVKRVLKDLEGAVFTVKKVTRRERKRKPAPSFITSTLQQEASRKLNFSVKKTMQIAQQLYEGLELGREGTVGLITYMRTDSTRVAEEAQAAVREYIAKTIGPEYVPEEPTKHKTSPRAQGAHEAIRPTDVNRSPEQVKDYLTRDQYRLYKLIWSRFVASQMKPALLEVTTIEIQGKDYIFRASGSVIRFPGFMKVYVEAEQEESLLPQVAEGSAVDLVNFEPKQHFTQPPPRYTEATLVKALEENGIGRPSTYAPIIATIQSRGYVSKEKKNLYPTELGQIVVELLKEYFPNIINVEFTANLEEKLDQVEEGEIPWQKVVEEFYGPFEKDLQHAEQEIAVIPVEDEISDETCPHCGENLRVKQGKYGKFLACPGFPECRYTKPYFEDTGVLCPLCKGSIVVRRSRKGRKFFGCANYPECDFVSWDEPLPKYCPDCGHFLVYRGRDRDLYCPECKKTIKQEEDMAAERGVK